MDPLKTFLKALGTSDLKPIKSKLSEKYKDAENPIENINCHNNLSESYGIPCKRTCTTT